MINASGIALRARRRVGISFEGQVSRTKQEFAKETDINLIVARHKRTGEWSHVNDAVAVFGDASEIPDFMGAKEIVMRGEALFGSLPADIRARFDNDPGLFLARAEDPEYKKEFEAIWADVFPKLRAEVKVPVEPVVPVVPVVPDVVVPPKEDDKEVVADKP